MSDVQVRDVVLQLPEYLRLIQNGANSHYSDNQALYLEIEKKILECVLNTLENPVSDEDILKRLISDYKLKRGVFSEGVKK